MSGILVSWVNSLVASQVDQFESEFANGYLFGEILAKYKIQLDFADFSNKQTADAKIQNFSRLAPSFSLLGIKLDSLTANQLMTEKKGVAGRVIFQLKTALDKLAPGGDIASSLSLGRHGSAVPTANDALRNSRVRQKPDVYEQMESTYYNTRLRSISALSEPLRKNALHIERFEKEKLDQDRMIEDLREQDKQSYSQFVSMRRSGLLQRAKDNRDFVKQWDEASRERHAQTQMRAREREQADLRFELTMAEQKKKRQSIANMSASNDMMAGIADFERTLQRIGDSGASEQQQSGSSSSASDLAMSQSLAHTSSTNHLQMLRSRLPDPKVMQDEAQSYLNKVKAKKEQETNARKEREKRRRKALVDQQKMYSEMERKRAEQSLLNKLTKMCEDERELAHSVEETKKWKDVITENRLLRERQYAEQRQRDFDVAMLREAQVERRLREEYERQTSVEAQRYRELEAQRQAQKHQSRVDSCANMVSELIDLAMKTADFCAAHNTEFVPIPTWREWTTLFVKGIPLDPNRSAANSDPASIAAQILNQQAEEEAKRVQNEAEEDAEAAEAAIAEHQENIDPVIALWDQTEYDDFLAAAHDWSPSDAPIAHHELINEHLHSVLESIHATVRPTQPPPEPPVTPAYCIKAVALGKPLSGKSLLAQRLAAKYSLLYLTPHDTLQDAINFTQQYAKSGGRGDSAAADALRNERARLGKSALDFLTDGKDVPDDILVSILMNTVHLASAEQGRQVGFFLDGFPSSLRAAQLLEKSLSGYEDMVPSPVKPKANAAPTPKPAEPVILHSGLDVVFSVDIPNETVFDRASGQRIDPVTSEIFHVAYNPPPTSYGALLARLRPVDEVSLDRAQLNTRLAAFSDSLAQIQPWLQKFENLVKPVSGSLPVDDLMAHAESVFAAIAERKQAEVDAKEEKEAALVQAEAEKFAAAEAAAAAAEADGVVDGQPAAPVAVEEQQPAEVDSDAEPKERVLDTETATALDDQWRSIEQNYIGMVKRVIRSTRKLRADATAHYSTIKSDFLSQLRAPDDETQDIVTAFQTSFNEVERASRSTPEMQTEWTTRAEQLRDQLWERGDAGKARFEQQRSSLLEQDGPNFQKQAASIAKELFLALIKSEGDKYQQSRKLVADYYQYFLQKPADPDAPPFEVLNVTTRLPKPDPVAAKKAAPKPDPKKDPKAAAKPPPRVLEVPEAEDDFQYAINKCRAVVTYLDPLPTAEAPADEREQQQIAAQMTEGRIFLKRIESIHARFQAHLSHIQSISKDSFERMDNWIGVHFKAQMDAVRQVHETIQSAIEKARPLEYYLKWNGTSFVVDEDQLVYDPAQDADELDQQEQELEEQFQ